MEAKHAQASSEMIPEVENNEDYDVAVADQPLKSITQYSRYLSSIDPSDHKVKLEDALRFIKGEILGLEEKMRNADIDISKVYEEIYTRMS